MTFHEFGKENEKILIMIHGACMSWKNFKENIRILRKDFHVIAVAVPGHDLYEFDEFTSMENVAKRIENSKQERNNYGRTALYNTRKRCI